MRTRIILLNLFLMVGLCAGAQQCRSFVKKNCLPELEPYTPNEQFNSAVLIPGDQAELNMTFYGGQEYRMFVCHDEILGGSDFKVLDSDRKEVYNSLEASSGVFDFVMQNTQQLIVEITIPMEKNPNRLIHQGCVAVMVGYKKIEDN